ncbi:13514_t:CDS:2, partial [Racocetra fulgida]
KIKKGGTYIADLGLSDTKGDGKIYGVVPYVAPEVLQGQQFTPDADIYASFQGRFVNLNHRSLWVFTISIQENNLMKLTLLEQLLEKKNPEEKEKTWKESHLSCQLENLRIPP